MSPALQLPRSLSKMQSDLERLQPSDFETEEARLRFLIAARSLCHRLEKPMEHLIRTAAVEPSYAACLKIGIDVGLFAALDSNDGTTTHSLDKLAKETNMDRMLLERILRMLAAMDTVEQVGDDTFAATKLSQALTERTCNSAIDFRYILTNPIFQHLPGFLKRTSYRNPDRQGESVWQTAAQTDLPFYKWLQHNDEAMDMFKHMMIGSVPQRGDWHQIYPVQEKLLDGGEATDKINDIILADLGGSSGHDLIRFAAKFLPNAQRPCLVLQDLPNVIELAVKSGQLPCAITPIPIDLTKEAPVAGSRAYFLHSIFHNWSDEEVRQMLRVMHPTLARKTADGRTPKLLVNENVFASKGVQPQPVAMDLVMMAVFGTLERTEAQWRSLLESAGYRITGIFSKFEVDESIIEAEAIASSR